MIYDSFANARLYHAVHPRLKQALDFAQTLTSSTADGKITLDGEVLFANVMGYETTAAASRVFEAHRQYIDLQVLLSGEERLDVAYGSLPVKQAYSESGDAELYFPNDEPVNSVILRPGLFTLLFPQDIHRPGCDLLTSQSVRKVVVKIKL